jgi:predicted RNA polymerase sigma factor
VNRPADAVGVAPVAEDLLRELAPQVLGALARRYGSFHDAEEATQDALLAATRQWPRDGIPANPRGWCISVGVRRMTDRLRSDGARRLREEREAALATADVPAPSGADDSLALMFLCCHPALTPGAAIPLTLRAVGGLTTAEIARAFLVPEATMAQRISRAKRKIEEAGARFEAPDDAAMAERLPLVLHVLYLVFNEGYATSAGAELARRELSGEAIRLVRAVHASRPDQAEVTGLLALMLLTDARRPARTGPGGVLVPLDEQDRSRWDRRLLQEGTALIAGALAQRSVGEYQLQAAIAAVHGEATTAKATDWPRILQLYELLERVAPNPIVSLNRAIAAAMVHGPAEGLRQLDELDEALGGHHRLAAARAHLLEQAGARAAARAAYQAAAAGTSSAPERDYLTMRAARLARGR